MNKYELTMEQRDQIMERLTEAQRHFLHHILVRGRRTRFARQLARMKFQFIPEEVTLEELESIIDEWDYIGFVDSGVVSPHTKCECGRSLRYQHEVLHVPTNTRKFFGIDHLQLHTGIDAHAVNEILKGFDVLDGEMNELLCKYRDGWQLSQHLFLPLPEGFEIPADIQEHLDVKMPLLDRHLIRLKNKLREFEKTQREAREQKDSRPPQKHQLQHNTNHSADSEDDKPNPVTDDIEGQAAFLFDIEQVEEGQAAFSFDALQAEEGQTSFLFDFEQAVVKQPEQEHASFVTYTNSSDPFYLPAQAQQIIADALPIGRVSTASVAEFLIERKLATGKRFSTGKPDVYIAIAAFLDKLCLEGRCRLTESSPEDRIYEKSI